MTLNSDYTINEDVKIYGGSFTNEDYGVTKAIAGNVYENYVTIDGTTFKGAAAVYGGYAANLAYSPNNYISSAGANATATAGAGSSVTSGHSFKASDNHVNISKVKEAGSVSACGGIAANSADADANDGYGDDPGVDYAYALAYANADGSATANGDKSEASTTHSFEASENEVVLSSTSASSVSVYGGIAANTATASTHASTTDYGVFADTVTNATASATGTESQASVSHTYKAFKNIVKLTDVTAASRVSVYGGYADSLAFSSATSAKDMVSATVTVNASVSASGDKSTAKSTYSFDASENEVTLTNVKGTSGVSVCGGLAESTVQATGCSPQNGGAVEVAANAKASGNKVYLYNTDATEIYGGKSSAKLSSSLTLSSLASGVTLTATADSSDGNRVELHGGTYKDNVYGGWSSVELPDKDLGACKVNGTASAKGNTIALYAYQEKMPQLDGVVLWGGYANVAGGTTKSIDASGNILELNEVKGLTAKNIKNFSTLNFTLPAMNAGETVLTLTDGSGTDITGAKVDVVNKTVALTGKGGSGEFKEGDEVVLLANANGYIKADDSIEQEKVIGKTNATLRYELKIQKKKDDQGNTTSIVLLLSGTREGDDDSQDGTGDKTHKNTSPVDPGSKSIAEGALAGLALAGEASNACLEMARSFSMPAGAIAPFIHVQGSSATYETGSSVHLNAVSLIAGLGAGLDTGAGNLSVGAFFEYGKGSYTTSNSFDNAPSINGDGDAWYMGGGLLAKMDFIPTGPGHFYVEGSAHMGQLHNEYDSNDFCDGSGNVAKFDMDSPYYALHAGLGYVWSIAEDHDLDVYGKYIWTRVQGTDDTLTTGDKIEYDDMDSSRVRAGVRYTYKGHEFFKPYIGAAWEHEFAGSCESKTFGYNIAAPSLEGDTGIGELGITMTPSAVLPLSINLGVQGYVGRKRGISGSCLLKYEF